MNDEVFALTVKLSTLYVVKYIQGDSVGNLNILGGDGISICEEKNLTWTVSTSEWCTDIQLLECTDTKAKWMEIKREILITVNLIVIRCLNKKSVTVRNKYSKIPPSTSLHFATRVRRSCDVRQQWRTQEFFSGWGGSTNSVQDRGQGERGFGGSSRLVRGSGGSCNLVQEISFHIVKFS